MPRVRIPATAGMVKSTPRDAVKMFSSLTHAQCSSGLPASRPSSRQKPGDKGLDISLRIESVPAKESPVLFFALRKYIFVLGIYAGYGLAANIPIVPLFETNGCEKLLIKNSPHLLLAVLSSDNRVQTNPSIAPKLLDALELQTLKIVRHFRQIGFEIPGKFSVITEESEHLLPKLLRRVIGQEEAPNTQTYAVTSSPFFFRHTNRDTDLRQIDFLCPRRGYVLGLGSNQSFLNLMPESQDLITSNISNDVVLYCTGSQYDLDDNFALAHEIGHATEPEFSRNTLTWNEARADLLAFSFTGDTQVKALQRKSPHEEATLEVIRDLAKKVSLSQVSTQHILDMHHNSVIMSNLLFELSRRFGIAPLMDFIRYMGSRAKRFDELEFYRIKEGDNMLVSTLHNLLEQNPEPFLEDVFYPWARRLLLWAAEKGDADIVAWLKVEFLARGFHLGRLVTPDLVWAL